MKSNKIFALAIGTFFGTGLSPKAPGTVGSAAAVAFFALLYMVFPPYLMAICTLILFLLGWWASTYLVKNMGVEDPQLIVMDEVVGIFITLLFVPLSWWTALAGFALFRFFDILKPWPVSWADSKVGGGLGVMLDDVLAGLYAATILQGIIYFVS